MHPIKRLFILLICFALLLSFSPIEGQSGDESLQERVEAVLAQLTPTERVAQLLVVTFDGAFIGPGAPVARLISDYGLGGVILRADNDNINGMLNTPNRVQQLINGLQLRAYEAVMGPDAARRRSPFIPLFVATTHEGNGLPNTQIATDVTPIPSNMALGATWQPDLAESIGEIVGRELSAIGINLLLGPPLDVLTRAPAEDQDGELGVGVFSGDPYWVGRFGQAYIRGIHEGSAGRMAVVPTHFPGLGASDRDPELEVPVVPRSIGELERADLVPYIAVTGLSEEPLATADGLQCATVRYQGESIRTVTRPLCVDEQALGPLLQLPELAAWRDAGGIMVSDVLGSVALRRWYDSTQPFPHRRIAREALLAGNDLLVLDNFGPHFEDDQYDNIVDVITFFAQLYGTDLAFQMRVDQAVRQVLTTKLRLYTDDWLPDDTLPLEAVQRAPEALNIVAQDENAVFAVAQQAVTLIAPQREQLVSPPTFDQDIVIFTDLHYRQQCSYCPLTPIIGEDALARTIGRLYGAMSSGQVDLQRVDSYVFSDLAQLLELEGSPLEEDALENQLRQQALLRDLRGAEWIVFATLDGVSGVPHSRTLGTFLEGRFNLLRNDQRVVVLAFGVPYYLSATDISKLTAYYGIYSTVEPFIDVAARALYQEISFAGAPPVSVPGVNYDLLTVTAPDPNRLIRFEVSLLPTFQARAADLPMVGDMIYLRTQPLLDRNAHLVPDGTEVVFTLTFVSEGGVQTQVAAGTVNGIAEASLRLNRAGRIEITAASLSAQNSQTVTITVVDNLTASNTPIAQETENEPASPVETAAASLSPGGSEPLQADTQVPTPQITRARLGPFDLLRSLVGLLSVAGSAFVVGVFVRHKRAAGIRLALLALVAGLLGYIYFGLGLPGADLLLSAIPDWAGTVFSTATAVVGVVLGWWHISAA